MKPTAGYAKPRRMTEPPPRARLNLQRRPKPPDPEEELEARRSRGFWRVVVLVALFHVLVILGASLYYLFTPAPKPPDQFITLLPPGDTVHGSPGAQQAHKLGATQQAAPHKSSAPPPPAPAHGAPPQPKAVTPPTVTKPEPTPIEKANAPAPIKPPKPVKPVKPKTETAKPKVKIDLHEVERADATDTPPKPAKHHAKKPVKNPDNSQDDADSSPDNTGLSKQQIAEKLGDKLDASGSHNAQKYGASGAPNGHASDFQDFYAMIANQVQDAWNSPMAPAQNEPIVGMHVERDGRVVPESVHLITSSGDAAYDQAALETVRHLGYLHEPLPDGCPPDITIRINPNPHQ
ncbi:MAG TPA: TonB C-terminal domain-containing protein [Candidatus Methylacidiphilales bacterium]|jgi:TonB family protein|nr:TonB C-terminal domain-containing protein [Candidatus Methylacidiphilales bacterium]